jgi:hypothetical protein
MQSELGGPVQETSVDFGRAISAVIHQIYTKQLYLICEYLPEPITVSASETRGEAFAAWALPRIRDSPASPSGPFRHPVKFHISSPIF